MLKELLTFLQRHHIRERSLSVVNVYLEEMAKEAKNIINTICDEQCSLSDRVLIYLWLHVAVPLCYSISQLLPKHSAQLIAQVFNKKKRDKFKKPEVDKPGIESYRKTREDLTT